MFYMNINFHWMHRKGWPNSENGLVRMAKELEEAGVDSVLLPYGPFGIDFSLLVPEILRQTNKIRIMIALPAYGVTPEYAAKIFSTMNRFGKDRMDLNLIAGNYDEAKHNFVVDNYPFDVSLINSHEKRVSLTEPWMEKFHKLINEQGIYAKLCVVGTSDITIRVANTYADYIIISNSLFNLDSRKKVVNAKPIFLIDPLILDDGLKPDEVKYHDYQYQLKPNHNIIGTYKDVINKIYSLAEDFNVSDFMILTDQVEINKITQLIKEISSKNV